MSSPVKLSLACARGSLGGPRSLLQLSEPLVGKRQKERGRERDIHRETVSEREREIKGKKNKNETEQKIINH